jgi:TonB-linked SusC/RagA family outer membrane protein
MKVSRFSQLLPALAGIVLCVTQAGAQVAGGTVTGRVVDSASQAPVRGARVTVVNTGIGTATDANGQYHLNGVPAGTQRIRVTRIGFAPMEQAVAVSAGQVAQRDFVARTQAVALEAIVSVGYGTQLARNVSGAVSTVTADQLNPVASTSVNQMMEGKAPGLNLVTRSAQPGGGVSVNIRGAISPRGNSTPLYVIDGVPISEYRSSVPGLIDSDLGFFGGVDRDPLAYLNPDDIEAVTVLKDASAAAIYGSAAANGVVLITTKSGKAGSVQVQYRANYTSETSVGDVPLMNAQQFKQQQNRLAYDRYLYDNKLAPYGTRAASSVAPFNALFTSADMASTDPGTNWLGLVTQNGRIAEHNASISGGSLATRAYASFDYRNEDGLLRGSSLNKYSGRLNIDQSILSAARLSLKVVGSRLDGSNASSGANAGGVEKYNVLQSAYSYAPTMAVYDSTGAYTYSYNRLTMNPAAFLSITDNSVTSSLFAVPTFELDVNHALKATVTGQFNQESTTRGFYLPRTVNSSTLAGGAAQKSDGSVDNYSGEGYLTYANSFGESELTVVGGGGYYKSGTEGTAVQGVGFFTDAFLDNNLSVASDNLRNRISSYKTERTKISQFGRLNYSLRERYILSAVVRRDGSSIFSENHKYGVFPGVSGAWIISDENFFKSRVPKIDELKLRVGYGLAGNESVLSGNTLQLYNPGYPFLIGNTLYNGVALSQVANPNLTWETVHTLNTGVDFGIINRRVTGSVDYFVKTAKNLLDFNPLPSNNAVGRVADNVGSTQSKGFEVALHTENIAASTFKWNSDFNFAHSTANWVERNALIPLQSWVGVKDPIREIYGWQTAGIIKTDADRPSYMPNANLGNLKYVDQNGDGKLDEKDVVPLGDSTPRWIVGFNNSVTFHKFDLGVFVYGQFGAKRYDNFAPDVFGISQSTNPNNTTIGAVDVWSASNPTGTRAGVAPNPYDSQNPASTDYNLFSASFVRLKSITLGYTLPSSLLGAAGQARAARLFVDIQNIGVRTDYPGFDPEYTEVNPYPKARNVSVGLQASF